MDAPTEGIKITITWKLVSTDEIVLVARTEKKL